MKKGVTPIIATVLLLMMTVAAAGAAYLWMNSLQSQIQNEVERTANTVAGASELEFQYRFRKCNATDSSVYGHTEIEAYVENTGQGNINQGPVGLTLIDDEGIDLEFVQRDDAMTEDFDVDTFLYLGFNVTTDLVAGVDYIIKISLPGGVTGSQICTAKD